MWILIEGPDGVGKSTLAQNLCAQYDSSYLHFGKPDSHPIDYWMREGLSSARANQVIDRLHLSEEAYGAVYRDGSKLTPHQFWLLEGWLWARNTMLVVCVTSWENMKANHAKVADEYHDERQKLIVEQFKDLVTRTSLPLSVYDYTAYDGQLPPATMRFSAGDSTSQNLHDLLHRRDVAVDFEDDGIGSVTPKVWLVGDQPNSNRDAPITPLFQPAFQSTCGEYLRRAVDNPYFWSKTHVSNSRNVKGEPYDLSEKWANLDFPVVIALGNNASKVLSKADIPHNKIPHPQWWRRFKNSQVKEYGDAIRQASV